MEPGLRIGTGRQVFQKEPKKLTIEGTVDLSLRIAQMLPNMAAELDEVIRRATALDVEIKQLAKNDADMLRLMEIPGVGPIIASALLAAIGTGPSLGKGRDLAAWLDLIPRLEYIRTVGHHTAVSGRLTVVEASASFIWILLVWFNEVPTSEASHGRPFR